jgi:hypothetical protein
VSATAALDVLVEAGITLRVDGSRLIASPADRITTAHRDLIRAYRPALVAILTSAPPPADTDPPRRLWFVRHPAGALYSHSFTPPASRAEVSAWYPGAYIEPEND